MMVAPATRNHLLPCFHDTLATLHQFESNGIQDVIVSSGSVSVHRSSSVVVAWYGWESRDTANHEESTNLYVTSIKSVVCNDRNCLFGGAGMMC